MAGKRQFLGISCALSYFTLVQSLQVLELHAPYKIRSAGNGLYLTASQQGIIGLKTGTVITKPYLNRREQQWNLAWDPVLDDNHDGYRMESRMEYLNQVTTFYPDGSTQAVPNIWEIIELRSGARMFRNKRTRKCLQVMDKRPEVMEKTCSIQNRNQHWIMELLDLNMKIGGRRYRIKNPYEWDYQPELYYGENFERRKLRYDRNDDDNDDSEEDDNSGSSEEN